MNLREQQDAVEFFMSLVESIDEALKALNQEQIMGKILGGSYSDQKICKGCPHRYVTLHCLCISLCSVLEQLQMSEVQVLHSFKT